MPAVSDPPDRAGGGGAGPLATVGTRARRTVLTAAGPGQRRRTRHESPGVTACRQCAGDVALGLPESGPSPGRAAPASAADRRTVGRSTAVPGRRSRPAVSVPGTVTLVVLSPACSHGRRRPCRPVTDESSGPPPEPGSPGRRVAAGASLTLPGPGPRARSVTGPGPWHEPASESGGASESLRRRRAAAEPEPRSRSRDAGRPGSASAGACGPARRGQWSC